MFLICNIDIISMCIYICVLIRNIDINIIIINNYIEILIIFDKSKI